MTDNEYTSMGENPGIALTTCTGCGTAGGFGETRATHCQNCGKPWAEADEVRVSRADLRALLDGCIQQHTNDEQAWSVCGCCGATSLVGHAKDCVVKRLDALAAASGDDGGTP